MNLNSVKCTTAFANTGFGKCTFTPREIVAALLVSSSFVITEADTENLQSFLEDAIKNPVRSERANLVPGFVAFTDSSDEVVREQLGYGGTATLRDGNYNWTFRFVDGGLCLLSSLQAFNGQRPNVIFIDAAGNFIGTKRNGGLAGIPVEDYWANKWVPSDGSSASANLSVYFSFRPETINQMLSFIQTANIDGFDLASLQGIQDLVLVAGAATASSAVISVADKCSGSVEDFGDLYGADLANDSLWTAVGVDGSVQTISAVAYNATTRVFTLTFDAPRTVDSIVGLAPINDLENAGIVGFEGTTVRVPLA